MEDTVRSVGTELELLLSFPAGVTLAEEEDMEKTDLSDLLYATYDVPDCCDIISNVRNVCS